MHESGHTPIDPMVYPMHVNKEGYIGNAIIFVMHKFREKDPRQGAFCERDNLIKIAEMWRFKPCVFLDATANEIEETLGFIANPPEERPPQTSEETWLARILPEHQAILVAVVSHGNADYFLTADEVLFPDQDIEFYLNESCCLLLRGKPKIILFNKCRIEEIPEPPLPRRSLDSEENLKYDTYFDNCSTNSNFLKINSCFRGTFSFRDTTNGSLVLSALPNEYEKYGGGMELRKFLQIFSSHMIKEINAKVKNLPGLATRTQCMTVEDSLLGDIFLPRGPGPGCEALEEMEVEQSHAYAFDVWANRAWVINSSDTPELMNVNGTAPEWHRFKPRFLRRMSIYKKAQHTFKPGGRKSRIKRWFFFSVIAIVL